MQIQKLYIGNTIFVQEKDVDTKYLPSKASDKTQWKIAGLKHHWLRNYEDHIIIIDLDVPRDASAVIYYDLEKDIFYKMYDKEFIKINVEFDKNIFEKNAIEKRQEEIKKQIEKNSLSTTELWNEFRKLNSELDIIKQKIRAN